MYIHACIHIYIYRHTFFPANKPTFFSSANIEIAAMWVDWFLFYLKLTAGIPCRNHLLYFSLHCNPLRNQVVHWRNKTCLPSYHRALQRCSHQRFLSTWNPTWNLVLLLSPLVLPPLSMLQVAAWPAGRNFNSPHSWWWQSKLDKRWT